MNICGVPTILRVGISAKAAPITIKDEGTVILPRMESGIAIAFGVWRLSTTIITDIYVAIIAGDTNRRKRKPSFRFSPDMNITPQINTVIVLKTLRIQA